MQIEIIKNRSDIGAGTRGSDMGIDAIEIAAINKHNPYFMRYPYVDVKTHNETVYNKSEFQVAHRINYVNEQCERVSDAVKISLKANHFPIVLSGDHSSALGTLSGISAAYPDKTIGAIWIDAHADLHTPYTSPSGNVHGMPMAAALGEDNLESRVNDVSEELADLWIKMKNIGTNGAKLKAEHLVYFGLRDTEVQEDELIERLNIREYAVHEMRYRSFETCLNEARERLKDCDYIYVSFDVDSLCSDLISTGTGTPVSKGFDVDEVLEIIKSFFDTQKVVCFEICEVNPLLDTRGNRMAETAFEVLEEITNYKENLVKA
jgi:arginase